MGKRVDFQTTLELITPNVYFQPPSNLIMSYPAIVYSRKSIDKLSANDSDYGLNRSYNVSVIDRNPDSELADKVLKLPFSKFDRQFISDGLNHFAFVIYY